MTITVLLDVDTGIDDSHALLDAVAPPEVDLLGVSCVAGNVSLDEVTANTTAVLDLGGRSDVEAAAGCARPIARPLVTTPETQDPPEAGHAVVVTASPDRVSRTSGST